MVVCGVVHYCGRHRGCRHGWCGLKCPLGCYPCRHELVVPSASSSICQRGPPVSCASVNPSASRYLEFLFVYLVANLYFVVALILGLISLAGRMMLWPGNDAW